MVTPPPTSPPGTCDRSATNASTLATQFAAASGGQTICLATGNYGSFTGSAKSGMVTLRALDGATVNLDVNFRGARNITLDGLTIAEALMYDTTQQITIRNSRFTGFVIIDGVANADILLDHNTHVVIVKCSGCWAGRISLPYGSATPSGVTVQNSTFRGGNADGIQAATGLSIIGNEFDHIDENGPNDQAHTDAIQILGASDVLVKGNYIHDSADGVVAYDGIDHATIEDNVIDLITGRWGIELYSDDSSIIRHNTLRYATTCSFSPCGHIMVDHKTQDPAGRGTVVVDNIAYMIEANNGSQIAQQDHNMVRAGAATGDFIGTPTYAGGSTPTTPAGFLLAAGSAGIGRASDGTNVGIR
ncbi:MAG: right-handed parallel beta-helix repeat-containing protein [Flavobacterium sp.]|nr:right-handed parallel beta-helix repeat-containing protein [Aeromicrobium sp.]